MLAKKYKAAECEQKWQEYWQKSGIYRFDPASEKEIYSIDTPPPTVNGKIHIGHIFSYSQAEIMARYMRMTGKNVFYPFGFDDNGLPTERLVEQKHGIKAHETTREHFNELCLNETHELEKQFKDLFISAGFSCDWDYEYSTISKKAQTISQRSFMDLYEKEKVYSSEAPALWCTECQTAIAQAELETKELSSVFHFLRFYLEDSEQYIEIATTRPELLAACQCILIHPQDEKNRWLLDKKIQIPLFHFTVPVFTDEKVELGKGSGLVMCCTFGDLTDLEWYEKYHFTFKEAILQNGTMSALCGKYEGMDVITARKCIAEDLTAQGHMIKQEKIMHNVATHERCGTPMEITIKRQWFIDILSNKEKYIKAGNQIHWFPEHMKSRYQNWVENLEWDWCISRQRYFGVPFPVWYCKSCGTPILPDIKDLPINPLVSNPPHPCICGCTDFIPEMDIMDTWATSSVTPLILSDWQSEDTFKRRMIPMSLRPNAHDIIRTWDFYTIVKNLYHTDQLPWNNIMISGHVMTSQNEKISKRKENSKMDPPDIIAKYSADAVRMWAATGSLGNDIVFSEDEFRNSNKLINKLWNASKFVIMHLEGFDKKDDEGNTIQLSPYNAAEKIELMYMDKWILQSFNQMFEKYSKYMKKYEIGLALGEIEKFFWGFCDDYIEIIKNRVYKPEIYGKSARKSGLDASYKVLLSILKCFAIYIPHITEEIYQGYFVHTEKINSLHCTQNSPISDIPVLTAEEFSIGTITLDIISSLRRYKSENNLSLKTDLDHVTFILPSAIDLGNALIDIKATCSCKNITIQTGNALQVII